MALPGLSLPGLNLAAAPLSAAAPAADAPRTIDLPTLSEFRFEVSFSKTLKVRLLSGTAEFFGTELAPNTKDPYNFSGVKGAIGTFHGCRLEVVGETESEYVAEETQMEQYANAHFAIEKLRDQATQTRGLGPRVLVVGPENAGKTSLVKILTAYAVRQDRQPLVVNLDPRQGMLSVPGSFTASAFASILDVEEGWGSSPISGPSPVPVKMPVVYHFGMENPEQAGKRLFRPLVTRMALAVTARLEEDPECKVSGCLIDAPGAISHGKGTVYENIQHVVSEFSVNVVFVLGSERLYSDLSRKYAGQTGEEAVAVVKLDKSGGCVDREEGYMKALRQQQIRAYFFGTPAGTTLSPHTHWEDFANLHIYKIVEQSPRNDTTPSAFLPGGSHDNDDDHDDNPTSTNTNDHTSTPLYERITPSLALQHALLAVTHAEPTALGPSSSSSSIEAIRDASVMGYVYVADVDEAKRKVRLLAPLSGRVPARALVWGSWPEGVPDLVG